MVRALALLVVLGLLGAGCAGGDTARPAGGAGAARGSEAGGTTAGGAGSAPQALIPVQASFSAHAMSQSPIGIAKESGYFAEEGLDVKIISIRSAPQNAAALLSGEVDVSTIGGIAPIRARMSGSDLLLIGATKPYFAGSIMSHPSITSGADLRGKRLGITNKGSNTDLMARAVLPRLGLEPDRDVTLFSTGGEPENVTALIMGNIDAASSTPPGDERLRNSGMHTLFDVTAARIPYPATALGTAGSTLANRPDVLERYLRGYARGVHRYLTDKEFALAHAVTFLQSEDAVANEAAYEVERGHMQANLELPLVAVQSTLDLIKAEDPRAGEARAEEFVDLRLVRKLQQEGFFDRLAAGSPTR